MRSRRTAHPQEAPWPAGSEDLLDYAICSGAPAPAVENLQKLEEEEIFDSMEEAWMDFTGEEDFMFNKEEYKWHI